MRTSFYSLILLMGVALFPPTEVASQGKPELVKFATKDGHTLVANFHAPQKEKPTVVMLHGMRSGKYEWGPLIEALVKRGWGVLAYDARGHGKSSKTFDKEDKPTGLYSFGSARPGSDWEKMINDVGAAIHYLKEKKGIEKSSVYLIGASLGANVAINYAYLSRGIKKVAMLSPGLVYAGIPTLVPTRNIKNTDVLMVASKSDSYAYQSATQLKKFNPNLTLWTDVKKGHGVQMLDAALIDRIIKWLE